MCIYITCLYLCVDTCVFASVFLCVRKDMLLKQSVCKLLSVIDKRLTGANDDVTDISAHFFSNPDRFSNICLEIFCFQRSTFGFAMDIAETLAFHQKIINGFVIYKRMTTVVYVIFEGRNLQSKEQGKMFEYALHFANNGNLLSI